MVQNVFCKVQKIRRFEMLNTICHADARQSQLISSYMVVQSLGEYTVIKVNHQRIVSHLKKKNW